MAKKKFRNMHITPADNGYTVHHEEEGKEPFAESKKKVFGHHERKELHDHIDKLMDAHEGVKDSPAEEKAEHEIPPSMNKLKARRYS